MNNYPTTYLGIPIEIDETLQHSYPDPTRTEFWQLFTLYMCSWFPKLESMVADQKLSKLPIKLSISESSDNPGYYQYTLFFDYVVSGYGAISVAESLVGITAGWSLVVSTDSKTLGICCAFGKYGLLK